MSEPRRKAESIILVHGAWSDGSIWARVIPQLRAAGLSVTAVQLPLTSLADDTAVVRRAIALEDGPIVLAGHAYGGVVITECGDHPKISGLVYVAAFAPDIGASAFSLGRRADASPADAEIRTDSADFLKLTPKGVTEDFAQDLPESVRETMIATQGPISLDALGAPATNAAWRSKPSWFVLARHDRTISPFLQQMMADEIGATAIDVFSSHVAMLSCPGNIADVLIEATRAPDSRHG